LETSIEKIHVLDQPESRTNKNNNKLHVSSDKQGSRTTMNKCSLTYHYILLSLLWL
jgi:hypothetical protein